MFDELKLTNAAFLFAVTFTFSHRVCNNKETLSLRLAGMPDFLEKLHNAALRAKNLEVRIHDYASVIKSTDTNRQPSQERLGGENTHTGGSGQIYAWDGYLTHQELYGRAVTCPWDPIEPSKQLFQYIVWTAKGSCNLLLVGMSIHRLGYTGYRCDETRTMDCIGASITVLWRKCCHGKLHPDCWHWHDLCLAG